MQGVIRASVTHDQNSMELKVPVLDIKIPKPSVGNEEKHSALSAAIVIEENNEEEDEVSEDDWDAFQSFPVSKNEDGDEPKTEDAAEGKNPSLVETSSDVEGSTGVDEFQERSINRGKDLNNDDCLEADKETHDKTNPDADKPGDNEHQEMEEELQRDITNPDANKAGGNEHQEMEEELQSSGLQEEATSTTGNEQVSSDHKPEVEAEGSINEDLLADTLQRQDTPEQFVSDSLALQQGSCESDNSEQSNGCEEDDKKDSINENKNSDPQQEMSENPVENEQNSAKEDPFGEHREE